MSSRYSSMELVGDNMFVVEERCNCGWSPGGGCGECYQGYAYTDCIDLNPLFTGLSIAGGLCLAWAVGHVACPCEFPSREVYDGYAVHKDAWWPGCGREAKP